MKKKSYEIKVVPDLLGLVSLLGVEKELGWGRGQFGRLFLKTNQVNTYFFVEGFRLIL